MTFYVGSLSFLVFSFKFNIVTMLFFWWNILSLQILLNQTRKLFQSFHFHIFIFVMWVWIIVDIQFFRVKLFCIRFYFFWRILLRVFFHIWSFDFFEKLHKNIVFSYFLRTFDWYCILILINNFERLLTSLDINKHFILEILKFGLQIFVESFLFESLLTLLN